MRLNWNSQADEPIVLRVDGVGIDIWEARAVDQEVDLAEMVTDLTETRTFRGTLLDGHSEVRQLRHRDSSRLDRRTD